MDTAMDTAALNCSTRSTEGPKPFCVVCGSFRDDLKLRNSGLKCPTCVGRKANKHWVRLQKKQAAQLLMSQSQTQPLQGVCDNNNNNNNNNKKNSLLNSTSISTTFSKTVNSHRNCPLTATATTSGEQSLATLGEADSSVVLSDHTYSASTAPTDYSNSVREHISKSPSFGLTMRREPSSEEAQPPLQLMTTPSGSCERSHHTNNTHNNPNHHTGNNTYNTSFTEAASSIRYPSSRATPRDLNSTRHTDCCVISTSEGDRVPQQLQTPPKPPNRLPPRGSHRTAASAKATTITVSAHEPLDLDAISNRATPEVFYPMVDDNSVSDCGGGGAPPALVLSRRNSLEPSVYNNLPVTPRDGDDGVPRVRSSSLASRQSVSTTASRRQPASRQAPSPSTGAGERKTTVTYHRSRQMQKNYGTESASSSRGSRQTSVSSSARLPPRQSPGPMVQSHSSRNNNNNNNNSNNNNQARSVASSRSMRSNATTHNRSKAGEPRRRDDKSKKPVHLDGKADTNTLDLARALADATMLSSASDSDDDSDGVGSSVDSRQSQLLSCSATLSLDELCASVTYHSDEDKEVDRSDISGAHSQAQSSRRSLASNAVSSSSKKPVKGSKATCKASFDPMFTIEVRPNSMARACPLLIVTRRLLAEILPALETVRSLQSDLPPLPKPGSVDGGSPKTKTAVRKDIPEALEAFINAVMRSPFLVRHPVFVNLLQLDPFLKPGYSSNNNNNNSSDNTTTLPLTSATLESLRRGGGGGEGDGNAFARTDSFKSVQSTRSSTMRRRRVEAVTTEDLDQVQLGNILGRGSYGTVYLGLVNTGNGPLMVAVKVMPVSDEACLAALRSEEEALRRVSHRGVVRVIGSRFLQEKGEFHIYTEYIECGTIHSMVSKFGSMPLLTVQSYVTQILKALHHIHTEGVVHCDIKGENILVTKNGRVKLTDFGCWDASASSNSANANGDSSGCAIPSGTPMWMAPEVVNGAPPAPPADIWALGCVGIEMLDRPLWRFAAETIANPYVLLYRVGRSGTPPHGLPTAEDIAQCFPDASSPAHKGFMCYVDFLSKCFVIDPIARWTAGQLLTHPFIRSPVGRNLRWPSTS